MPCAWARFAVLMPLAWRVVLYEGTKAAYEPYARAIEDLIPPLVLTRALAAEVTELRLGITDYVAQMTAEFVAGAAGSGCRLG